MFPFVPMIALLCIAAATDVRNNRIPNWLTVGLVMSGLAQSFLVTARTVSPGMSLLGLLVGFALTFVLFAMGALGGGDVKLLAGVGAWVGPIQALEVFLATAVIGMVIVLVQCAWQRRLPVLFRNSALLVINLVHTSELGVEHVSATGKNCRSIDRPLPYAVPVLLATLLVIAGGFRIG